MKKKHQKFLLLSFIVLIGLFFLWAVLTSPVNSQNPLISSSGIHWHAKLEIYINGEKKEIPKNIGIEAFHKPVHTHETDGIIHMEFDRSVFREDIKIKKFFENWNKTFSQNCIFEYCNREDKKVTLKINGVQSPEFAEYQMKDNDNIEIRFE